MESTFELYGSMGRKKIEFLVQEISRELNTLCSKSCRIESTNLTIEAKTEIEKPGSKHLNMSKNITNICVFFCSICFNF